MTAHHIGLVGAGIGTSLSPLLHETEARVLGLDDYRYELIDLDVLGRTPADAPGVVRAAVADGFTGLNITHPCKQTVIAGLDELSPQAAVLGAVNTVVVQPGGRLVGHNTDYSGFLTALRTGLPAASLGTVVLAGAGGAGAAVAHALGAAGVRRLLLVDPVVERATEVASAVTNRHPETHAEGVPTDTVDALVPEADGVVNASPIGMEGHDGAPFDVTTLQAGQWVADIVYRPVRTALLEAAAARGCRTLDGAQMLVAQAADTFRLVTGVAPDPDRMRRHLDDVLASRAALAS